MTYFHGKHSFSWIKLPFSMQSGLFLVFYNLFFEYLAGSHGKMQYFPRNKRNHIGKCFISRERSAFLFPTIPSRFFSQAWGTRGKCHISREKGTLFFCKNETLIFPAKKAVFWGQSFLSSVLAKSGKPIEIALFPEKKGCVAWNQPLCREIKP